MMKKLIFGALAVVLIAALWFINSQMTMNFGILGFIFLFVIIVLGISYHRQQISSAHKGHFRLEGITYSVAASAALLFLGFLSIYTLDNYFFANRHVYRNIDHHTVRLDGIDINNPHGFVLAANSARAFFDDVAMGGRAVITSLDQDTLNLELTNFSRPIFINHYNGEGRCVKRTLANASSLVTFTDKDTLQLRTRRNNDVYKFYMNVVKEDSVDYHLVMPDGTDYLSEEHRFVTQGLPLSMLIQGAAVTDADFSDLSIVRTTMHMQVKKDQRLAMYRDIGFALEVKNAWHDSIDNYAVRASVHGNDWQSLRQHGTETLRLGCEQVFTIGYDMSSTHPAYFTTKHAMSGNGALSLVYKMPLYHYLAQSPEKSYSCVTVRTSMNIGNDQLSELPDNIMLFDVFSHSDNANTMKPMTISFIAGPTTQELEFLYSHGGSQTPQTVLAGKRLQGAISQGYGNDVEWIASIEDLKQSSPYQPDIIKLQLLIFILALSVLLLWGGVTTTKSKKGMRRNTFTTVEFVAYAVTIYLVTFRWFLLWRTSVFPPVENISYYEFYGLFRSTTNGRYLTMMMCLMVVAIAIGKGLILHRPLRRFSLLSLSRSSKLGRWLKLAVALGLATVAFAVKLTHLSPLFQISIPVLAYLLTTVLIDRNLAPCPVFRLEDRNGKGSFWKEKIPYKLIAAHVAAAFAYAAILILIDSGYGILFLTFSVFWMLWLLQVHVAYYMRRERWRIAAIFALLLLMGLLIKSYKTIIGILDQEPMLSMLSYMAVAGLFISTVACYILKIRKRTFQIGFIAIVTVLFVAGGFGFRSYLTTGGQHTAQRIAVHFSKPDDVMEKITDDRTEHRYLQAALNHMIIGQYTDRGDSINLVMEDGHGYFKMQPHSKTGALWNAQLTDISMVRFVIAEHSGRLPLVFFLFFLLMVLYGALQPLYHRWARSLLIQIPLLLFVHSLLIWMATTQRFIFLGQDFPLVSINSKLTLVYYFGLVMTWVLIAIYEKRNLYKLYVFEGGVAKNYDAADPLEPGNGNSMPNAWRFSFARTDATRVAVALILCVIGAQVASRGTTDNSLELTRLMQTFSSRVGTINDHLEQYQKGDSAVHIPFQRDMSLAMARFNDKEHIDNVFADFPFGQRLWKHFLERDSRHNSSHNILHARLNREGKVTLSTHNKFQSPTLPMQSDQQWRGNFVAVSDTVLGWRLATSGLTAYRLPASWMADGRDHTIVNAEGCTMRTNDKEYAMREGIYSTYLIDEHAHTSHPADSLLGSVVPRRHYLARNILINNQRTFFFPQGEELFWIRNLALEVQQQKQRLPVRERTAAFNDDVVITLSEKLTSDIYHVLDRFPMTRRSSVIVANGDGDVLALVDHDERYHLDPNDHRQVNRFIDSLYMYGLMGSDTERRAFGNKNLLHISRGPGSTQKPLVWTAVASHLDYDWRNLYIEQYNLNYVAADNNKFELEKFNGASFLGNHPFRPLKSDEHGGARINVADYMTHSSNVYNALMAYIGSFTPEQLTSAFTATAPTWDKQTLFARISQQDMSRKTSYLDRFPILTFGDQQPLFTLNQEPSYTNQTASLLETSMNDWFFRDEEADPTASSFYSSPAGKVLDATPGNRSNGYAYLEKSYFNPRDGQNQKLFMERAVRSTAIGAQAIWEVTPWKMAEAYGRMATLNRNYQLTVMKHPKPAYSRFDTNPGYDSARPLQLKGMSDVLTRGTASLSSRGPLLGARLGIQHQEGLVSNQYQGYYFYAKTGTISARGETDKHRLGIIITNGDLASPDTDLSQVRFVVIYIALNKPAQSQAYADIVNAVLDSDEFKNYMNS